MSQEKKPQPPILDTITKAWLADQFSSINNKCTVILAGIDELDKQMTVILTELRKLTGVANVIPELEKAVNTVSAMARKIDRRCRTTKSKGKKQYGSGTTRSSNGAQQDQRNSCKVSTTKLMRYLKKSKLCKTRSRPLAARVAPSPRSWKPRLTRWESAPTQSMRSSPTCRNQKRPKNNCLAGNP
jgi:hypothetical protein